MEKAIEDIVRTYLRQETEFGPVAVTPKSTSREQNAQGVQASASTPAESPEKPYGDDVDSEHGQLEQEFMQALYQCLEEKGVLKEVQAFIRQRLVIILKGAWPNLVQTKCDTDSHFALALIQDFLCTHKLLFTFSVFTSELVADNFKFKDDFGKLRAQEAEALLCELHIPKDSSQSSEVLKQYFSKGHRSLLECIIHTSAWKFDENEGIANGRMKKLPGGYNPPEREIESSLEEKLKRIDEDFQKILASGTGQFSSNLESVTDQRIRRMIKEMEQDKEIQIHHGIEKFKREELVKIRKELEKIRIEFLQKEKQMLGKYEEKVARLQIRFDRERQQWQRRKKDFGVGVSTTSAMAKAAGDSVQSDDQELDRLENFHQSLLAKYNDLIADAEPSRFDSVSGTGFGMRRELERSFLLKEAALRNTIDKLTSENEQLKAKAAPTSTASNSKPLNGKEPPAKADNEREAKVNHAEPEHWSQHISEDEDAHTFLQYTVECQAEQIENLQKQINELTAASAKSKQCRPEKVATGDIGLDEFLHESKRRFWEIDEEAQKIKARMSQLQAFNKPLLSSPRTGGGLTHDPAGLAPAPKLLEPKSQGHSISAFPTQFSTLPAPQKKVHFTMPSFVDINLPSSKKAGFQPIPTPEQVQAQPQPAETNTDSDDSLSYQQPLVPSDVSNAFVVKNRLISISDGDKIASNLPEIEPKPTLKNSRETIDAEVGVVEPIVTARKAYLTGALIRDKVTSSSSDEPDHDHDRSKGQHESTNGRGKPTASFSPPVPVQTSSFTPTTVPAPVSAQAQPSADQVISIVSMLEDMEFETGKASPDEDDGLW